MLEVRLREVLAGDLLRLAGVAGGSGMWHLEAGRALARS